MKHIKIFLISFFSLFCFAQATPITSFDHINDFVSVCYHDVRPTNSNAFGVTPQVLTEQFQFLKDHYNVVSFKDIQDASSGLKTLPPKSVLITFDDGLLSFYENAYPLVKKFKFPVVLAVVGKWTNDGIEPNYGLPHNEPAKMASWKQLKEMSDSGLVLIASHSYNLHQGHLFNPQGNSAPQAGFFRYDPKSKSYETESAFLQRIELDLAKNNALIKKHIGRLTPIMVWPYGSFNGLSMKAANHVGLSTQFSILGGINNAKRIDVLHRGMIFSHMTLEDFAKGLLVGFDNHTIVRSVAVDIDSFWSLEEEQKNEQLGSVLEQVYQLKPNVAIVPAFSKNGESYFPFSGDKDAKVVSRGDYLNRVTHTLANRARVSFVYASIDTDFLKDRVQVLKMINDLAKFTDMDGIFFDATGETKINEELLALAMQTAIEMRPEWRFGMRGFIPAHPEVFEYLMLSYPFAKSDKLDEAFKASSELKQKVILSLRDTTNEQLKKDAEQGLKDGYRHLHYDISVNMVNNHLELRDFFSVKPNVFELPRGEVK